MKRFCFFTFYIIILFTNPILSQEIKWTTNPFDNKEFIKNNGQFSPDQNDNKGAILYGVSRNAENIFFMNSALTFRLEKIEKKYSEKQMEALMEKDSTKNKELFERTMTKTPLFVHIEWLGANKNNDIIPEEKQSFYYNYSDPNDRNRSIKCDAYKKIVYKNLYPQIDVEYFFLDDKDGLKYNIILHPGGDLSNVKMRYNCANKILIENGNVIFTSGKGNYIDHAPVSFSNNKTINTKFVLLDSITVGFSLQENYDNTKQLTIDPWVTSPTFNVNKAFDVDFDQYGNVYAYGSYNPFELVKLDNGGAIQWKYIANFLSGYYYGDLMIDYFSGSCYLFEGFEFTGSKVIKLNPLGSSVATFSGDPLLNEFWRVQYNKCSKTFVIGAGGTSAPNHTGLLDTNLTGFTPFNPTVATGAGIDVALLAIDDNGTAYMGLAENGNGSISNTMFSLPATTILPLNWSINSNKHHFQEVGSVNFLGSSAGSFISFTNGFNGMAVNNQSLYTYDGHILRKWDKTNGNYLQEIIVHPDSFKWGGIDANNCDTVYVGVLNKIHVYDGSLNLVSSINVADTIYDLKLNGNKIYACGNGFVSEISIVDNCNIVNLFSASPLQGEAPLTISINNYVTNASNYFWDFGNGTTSTLQNPDNVVYSSVGTYEIKLIVTNSPGCLDSMSIFITVENGSSIIIPNVFSPNGDSKNDVWSLKEVNIASIDIVIYNRWGLKVRTISTTNTGWNGKNDFGSEMPDGTYYFVINAKGKDNATFNEKGFIELVR